MSTSLDIADLASALVARVSARPEEKIAAATSAGPAHPAVAELRKLAAIFRELPDANVVTLEDVTKVANAIQPGTGAQSPGQGAAMGTGNVAPTLPALKTTNLGITAGAGGAPPTMKAAAVLRKVASDLRAEEQLQLENTTKKAHAVLRTAVGLQLLRQRLAR